MSYVPAPQPGVNPAFLPSQGGQAAPPYPVDPPPGYSPGYPPLGNEGYPPSQGYPLMPMENYPAGGYPQPGGYGPAPMTHQPDPGKGYPQPGGYGPPAPMTQPDPGMGYPQQPGGYGPAPMTHQPDPGMGYPPPGSMQPPCDGEWMVAPTGNSACPPGLEYLTMVDQLLVKQKVEVLELFLNCETRNKYSVMNSLGQKVYYAKEDNDCCTLNCCGSIRPFVINVRDNAENEVIRFSRDLRCDSCLCPCYMQRLEVMSPPGTLIGTVIQEWNFLTPKFRIENELGETVLKIEGSCWTVWCKLCGDVDFEVLTTDNVKVGKVTKQWSGFLREAFTKADHFAISFPMDLDVKMKAVLLGALFLIEFIYYEQAGQKGRVMEAFT